MHSHCIVAERRHGCFDWTVVCFLFCLMSDVTLRKHFALRPQRQGGLLGTRTGCLKVSNFFVRTGLDSITCDWTAGINLYAGLFRPLTGSNLTLLSSAVGICTVCYSACTAQCAHPNWLKYRAFESCIGTGHLIERVSFSRYSVLHITHTVH